MTQDRPTPTKHTFSKTRRLVDAIFKVDEYEGEFEKFDNAMSAKQQLLIFDRGDSVAALVFDPIAREVILVEQFRLATALNKGQGDGWILELPAGILQPGETVHGSLVRELLEETGYQVNHFVPIATFFPSPGATTERIFLLYTEVRRTLQVEPGGGVVRDREDIRIVRMPLAEFFAKLRAREFEDAKLIIAAQWLKDRRAAMPADDATISPPVEHRLDFPPVASRLGRKTKPEKYVGYIKGPIEKVKGVDAWVNPLTSDMLLDRYTDRTISAAIRAHGARKFPDGSIERDVIGDALRDAMKPRHFVNPSTVIDTTAGALESHNKVKRIFHVATTRVAFGTQSRVDLDTLDACLENVLKAIEAKRERCSTVLAPMIGTGEGALLVNQVAPRLLQRAIGYFKANPKSRINKIYLLAYTDVDADVVIDAFERCEAKGYFVPKSTG